MLAADLHESMYSKHHVCYTFSCVAVLPMCVICPTTLTIGRQTIYLCVNILFTVSFCHGSKSACERKPTPLALICIYMLHTARYIHDSLWPVLQISKAAAQQLTDTNVRSLAACPKLVCWSQVF